MADESAEISLTGESITFGDNTMNSLLADTTQESSSSGGGFIVRGRLQKDAEVNDDHFEEIEFAILHFRLNLLIWTTTKMLTWRSLKASLRKMVIFRL